MKFTREFLKGTRCQGGQNNPQRIEYVMNAYRLSLVHLATEKIALGDYF